MPIACLRGKVPSYWHAGRLMAGEYAMQAQKQTERAGLPAKKACTLLVYKDACSPIEFHTYLVFLFSYFPSPSSIPSPYCFIVVPPIIDRVTRLLISITLACIHYASLNFSCPRIFTRYDLRAGPQGLQLWLDLH